MNYFIIGDIHGCYFTFSKLLEYWDPNKEYLISVGDLIDRGHHSALVIDHCRKLSLDYNNTVFLKGNHEAEMVTHFEKGGNNSWLQQGGSATLEQFAHHHTDLNQVLQWFKAMPLKFEQDNLLVSHAGIADTEFPFLERHIHSVLWNRAPLKNIGKLQVHGHTPIRGTHPEYNSLSNSWNIDTGAYLGFGLTGLKLSAKGIVTEAAFTATDARDITL